MTDEGREIARIEVERIESRDGALHITGHLWSPPPIDGDVIEGQVIEGKIPGFAFEPIMTAEDVEQRIAAAGGIEQVLKAYEGIAVNGMTAEETMRALREKCGLGEVLEGEVIDAPGYGTSYHYPHCNIGACTGCIPREAVDDYAGLWDHMAPLLRDFEAHVPYPPTHPRGHRSAYMVVDEWTGPVAAPTYMTVDEAREWVEAPTTYPEARAIEEPRLTWSDIQIKKLGNGT